MLNFLRTNKYAAIFLTLLRVYIGYDWMTHGYEKLKSGGFDASGFIQGAIANSGGDHPAVQGWWAAFLEKAALPNVELFNFLVPWGEFLVGLGLILGVFTTFTVLMGLTMNFAFLFSGTVSTNAQLVLLQMFLLVAGYNAAQYGLDRYVLPFIKKTLKKETTKVEIKPIAS
ncbi:DoxX family protein [Peribacillus psychrosaccharolyticus]|uniref:DoxX family protein n=1 Tax=Peribacillus psychrosaccharolyticus TaxID=1407 RepID=A0A974NNX9_PERPY|nr:DoxX family protein [Peribacillus psychrosaccharolyticus]MEC2057380.1 DoxX family protein [Peribacillus psychrosaccharolyticus]MED3742794.1 DoxX family protein [Peribacillus psychrosaccharolyticus]QQT01132.1 DoxX family protein [Peribacillus psychrosaccharolyticus]